MGKETLCRLCSGDIHYLIGLVREMVAFAGGPDVLAKATAAPRVLQRLQNRAIREAAGGFLKNLRSIPKHGDQLVAIVTAFGNVAHSCVKFRNSRNEAGNPPHQASRNEPYEPFTLSDEAQRLYDELLRYSVFIEDFRGKSRRGKVVPRLYLRRFLIPHFNLTFSTRTRLSWSRRLSSGSAGACKFEDQIRLRASDPRTARQAHRMSRSQPPNQPAARSRQERKLNAARCQTRRTLGSNAEACSSSDATFRLNPEDCLAVCAGFEDRALGVLEQRDRGIFRLHGSHHQLPSVCSREPAR